MIHIRGELCYSPHPPERYGKGPHGHGPWCQGDLQVWNLLFLSCPKVEDYLKPDAVVLKVAKSIPGGMLASAMASLNGINCKRLFPTLRDMLKMPPMQFVEDVQQIDYRALPMYLYDNDWLRKIHVRAADISADMEAESWIKTGQVLDGILRAGNKAKPTPPGD